MIESEKSCPTLCNSMDCNLPGFSVHGILQARILEWVAILFFRVSSWPGDRTWVSCFAGIFFTIWATRRPEILIGIILNLYIHSGNVIILAILSVLIHKYRMLFHLFRYFLIFPAILCDFQQTFYTSFIKYNPKYFTLLKCCCKWTCF